MAKMKKSNIKKANNPYFDRWQSLFSDLAHKCSLMCLLENECLETPIRIPSQVWDDTDSLESSFMSKSVGEVVDTIDKIYEGLYNARYSVSNGYDASTKKSKMRKALPIYDDHEIICPYCGEVARPSRDPMGAYVAYCNHCDRPLEEDELAFGDDIGLSTKKSKPKTTMSFEDNVNKMRVNNYARTGNINTVMKKRD